MKNGFVEGKLHPRSMDWFEQYIGSPTNVQKNAWSLVKDGSNVLIISPTGSGKTLAAIMPVIDPIVNGKADRSKTSIVYISPMKALGADIVKTLNNLSEGIGRLEGKKERKWGRGRRKKDEILPDAKLHIGIRTGDVPQSERRRMLIDPPELLVITPENLLLMLCSKARDTLTNVSSIIVDEVHEMVSSKRGSLLSLTLELLTEMVKKNKGAEPLRIGLSATVRPESTAARYLGGQFSTGDPRPVELVKEESRKEMVIEFRTLLDSLDRDKEQRERIMEELGKMMDEDHGPLVIFHNTRRSAEEMAYALVQRGHPAVMPHHGSLGADVRKMAEEGLKSGELKAIVSSTSLELGIDIGKVDTVCQIASPKDPLKMLQRFGRSGHGLGRISHGMIYPIDGIDLIESLAVSRAASQGKLERLKTPKDPMDVLAQFAIGLSLNEGGTDLSSLWDICRRAYPFQKLKKKELRNILSLLSERLPGPNQPPPRLWYEQKAGIYFPRRNTGQAFYLNCGTIPKETSYRVYDESSKRTIGDLSRDFSETLYERDVILLGSKPYRITAFSGSRIFVHEEPDAQPTVPSWSGEIVPRPFTVASEIMNILSEGCGKRNRTNKGVQVRLDNRGRELCNEVLEILEKEEITPKAERWPIEVIKLNGSRRMYIILLPLGRKVTETLGRVLAYGIRRSIGAKIDYVATDDGFAIVSPKPLTKPEIISAFGGMEFEKITKGLVLTSSIFRSRFTHCLNKSLLVLSRFRGKDTGAIYKRNRVENLLGLVMDSWYSENGWSGVKGPMKGLIVLAEEALKEVFTERIDIDHCKELIDGLSEDTIHLEMKDRKKPSILGKSIIRSWKGTLKALTKEKRHTNKDPVSPIEMQPKRSRVSRPVSMSTDERSIRMMEISKFLREKMGTSHKLKLNEHGFLNLKELYFAGEHIPVKNAINLIPHLPFPISSIHQFRRKRTMKDGDLGKVMRWLPFFSHPLELLYRSEEIGFHDIRSAYISGKILPIRSFQDAKTSEIEWAGIFRELAPDLENEPSELLKEFSIKKYLTRSEIGGIIELSGDDLTEFISELMNANIIGKFPKPIKDILGDKADGYVLIRMSDRFDPESDPKLEALERFLRFFGPFDSNELSQIFGWSFKDIWNIIPQAIEEGILEMGIGPPGPLTRFSEGNENVQYLWLWSYQNGREISKALLEEDRSNEIHLLTYTDPGNILTNNRRIWVDKDRIRGANNNVLLALRGGEVEATISMVETVDLIRISDIEVHEFDNIGSISSLIAERLEDYTRLGYRAFVIEKIMGIPSGEAADTSVNVFLENGFRKEDTPKGSILVKGPHVLKGITREGILLEMFRSQGLVEGYHWHHPIEVVSKLGSIVDRWEILSRIGSSRYRKLTVKEQGPLLEKNRLEWKEIFETANGKEIVDEVQWDDIISTWGERLSDIKDLTKRFSLIRGTMEQPYPIWSLGEEFDKYPPESNGMIAYVRKPLRDLLGILSDMDPVDIGPYLKSHDHRRDIEELLRAGLLLEDGWGDIKIRDTNGDSKRRIGKGRSNITRGLLQKYWLIRWARRLSIFTLEDLINYSPGFIDHSKVRLLLRELVGTVLEQHLTAGSGIEVVYCIKGLDMDRVRIVPEPDQFSEIIVISPKDRMSRVIIHDIKGTIARGHGFSIFKGGRPIALISIKKLAKSVKNTEFGENIQGSTSLEYWSVKKAWVDLRFRRKDLLKSIRRAFYSLGCQLLTDDEKIKLESLYRDVEKSKKETL